MTFIPSNTIIESEQSNESDVQDINVINESNISDDGEPLQQPENEVTENNDGVLYRESTLKNNMFGYEMSIRTSQLEDVYGSPSIFNKGTLFVYPSSSSRNSIRRFHDIDGETNMFPNINPTYSQIIELSKIQFDGTHTNTELKWADFVYCKYFEKIPTNRLLILRRYPFPTYNNLQFPLDEEVRPLSTGITYFGGETGNTLSEFFKLSGYKNYKDLTASLEVISGQGQNKSMSDTPLIGAAGSTVNKGLRAVSVASGRGDISGRERVKNEALAGKNWENERKGEENVIHKTVIADVGVGVELAFDLIFEYKLRSYNGVNPRIAMLDLITNLMTLTHTNASFWGGTNIVLPNNPKFPFIGDQDAYYRGDYSSYLGSVMDSFSGVGEGLSNLLDGILSGDLSSIGAALGNAGSKILDLQSSKSRSSVIGLKALLDSSPVGNYHLTIGNPLEPIGKIGNLICPKFELSFGDEIGYNGFPTTVKLNVSLKLATPLDSTGVQSIFANGISSNRMYMKPETFISEDGKDNEDAIFNGISFRKDDIDRMDGVVF